MCIRSLLAMGTAVLVAGAVATPAAARTSAPVVPDPVATSTPTAEEPADPALFGTTWVAQAAVEDDVLTAPTRPEASASFTLDGAGGITGTYGCDHFSGPATASGNTLTVGALEIPLILCIIGNSVLAEALSEVFAEPATYVVRGDLLYLSREGGPVVILQAREPVGPATS